MNCSKPTVMKKIWEKNLCIPETVHECVHNLISRRVEDQPHAPAICISNGQVLSYRDLDTLSNQLASQLRQIIPAGTIVPLCFEKSIWTPVAMLAVLKAGGAFVLLDVSQPEARLQSIVRQACTNLICCSVKSRDLGTRLLSGGETKDNSSDARVIESDAEVVILTLTSTTQKLANGDSHTAIDHIPKAPESACYVVFTSGSTGIPKGAVLSHSSICSAFRYQLDQLGFTPQSRVFDFASHAFDVAAHNMLATLVAGGCLCVPTEDERLQDPAAAMAAMDVTLVNLTPSVARLLDPHRVPTLQTLIFLGETLSQTEAQRWTISGNRVINTYGPAECTPISTIDLSTEFREGTKNMGIGAGVGALCWVVDPGNHDALLSPGQVGELLLEGPLIGMGYLHDPEKTAQAFISNPSWLRSVRPFSRLYKTGDLVQQTANGDLLFMGRKDSQVKIHGQRVELGEIEYHVQAHFPGAVRTVVEAVPSATGISLVAFVQVHGRGGYGVDEDTEMELIQPDLDMHRDLSKRLPGYMVPDNYIRVPSIPHTASGKTDRRSLRESGTQLLTTLPLRLTKAKAQPATDNERKIQALFGTVLQRQSESIGTDDSFLAVGGDSLAAIRLVAQARKQGILLRAVDVMSPRTTLRDLAQTVSPLNDEDVVPRFSFIDTHDQTYLEEIAFSCKVDVTAIDDVYPCTPLQECLVALTMQRPRDYILQMTLPMNGLNEQTVQGAWQKVYNETAILRTRICQTKLGLVQVVIKSDKQGIQWTNGHNLGQYLEADKLEPMNLGRPFARFAIMKNTNSQMESKCIAITLHHALYDAWSLDLVIKRVKSAYLEGQSSSIPSTLCNSQFNKFLKYVQWRRNDPAVQEYWQNALEHTESIQFPAVRNIESKSLQMTAKIEYMCRLKQGTIRTSDATLSTVIRGALAILLSWHTASHDVVFGATVSGRNASVTGIDAIVGPTIATVPFRVQLDNFQKTPVSGFLRELQAQVSEMIPFEQAGLQQIAKLGEGPRRACDFQTLLVVQPQVRQDDEEQGMHWQTDTEQLSTYALTLECCPRLGGSIEIQARYNPAALDSWQLEAILEQLEWIINQLADVRCASQPLIDIDMLPPRHQGVIWGWNDTVPAGVDRCLHEIIRDQVTQRPPNHPAVCAWDGNLTYTELDQYTDQLALYLLGSGLGKGALVPICFEKSVFSVIAMLAILKAGAAFVPVDPTLPSSRRQTLLDETAASLIITSPLNATLFEHDSKQHVVQLSWGFLQSQTQPHENGFHQTRTESPSANNSVAYVLFTSGTTGRPKGVVVGHRAASSSCIAHGKILGFSETTRALQFSSYAFDACIAEIFTTLIFGGSICIPCDSDRQSRLAETINSLAVNWTFLTPTVAQLIEPSSVPCLKSIALGGEKVSSADAERWNCDGCRVFIAYGPTECCVFCSIHNLSQNTDSSFIGLPSGCVAWVVDPNDHHKLMPLGSIGELLIEGPILAHGYLNDIKRSAGSFIANPTWLVENGRQGKLYKTGDLVQYALKSKADGSLLRYIGRKDTQVKIRGQRLELADVEHHARQCIPHAKRVIADVITPSHTKSSELLVAFVEMQSTIQPKPDQDPDDSIVLGDTHATILSLLPELAQQVAQRLPRYMVPALYISVAGPMPQLISSGKIDRGRLREIGNALVKQHRAAMEVSADEKRAPSSGIELRLQRLWSRMLGLPLEQIGLDDNFFLLGGDSITAMKLVAEAQKDSLVLTVADVIQAPMLAAQARLQEQSNSPYSPSRDDVIEPFSLLSVTADVPSLCSEIGLLDDNLVEDIYPCSPLQEGIFALASKNFGDYILHNVLELADNLQIDSFKTAWEETVRLTPILRTRIMSHHELGLLQIVQKDKINWIQRNDCSIEGYLQETKLFQMGLGKSLSRFALLGSPTQPQYFVWTIHHALYDGWSLPLMVDMATGLYLGNSHACHQQPFRAFVKYVQQQKGPAADTYWRHSLQNLEASPFPTLPPHIREPVADATLEQEIPAFATNSLGISISTVLRGALALVIGHHTGSSDVVFGATLSGRSAPVPSITNIIGPTIATVPFRVRQRDEDHASAIVPWLHALQQKATDMIPFEQTGLQNISRLNHETQSACQFQTLLVIQTDDDALASSRHPIFGTWQTPDERGEFTTYALTLEYLPGVGQSKNGRFRARFDPRVITAWTVERLIGQWSYVTRQLLTATMHEPDPSGNALLEDIDLLPPQDHAILRQWNIASPVPAAIEQCLHVMIIEQARARPTELAIDGCDGRLTFEELDNLSDRLAEHLLDLRVGPEILVPLCFPKSSWTIVAMLSVLKAGGAFVLLDPTHPTDRLRMLCEKTRATIAVAFSPSTASRIEMFVETVVIVDNQIATPGWRPLTVKSASPISSPPLSNPPSSSSSTQLVSPRNTAYVIFTSGSTGTPKGCKIEHRSYCSAAVYHGSSLQFSHQTRALQFGSYSFAGAIMEILMTLIHGGCVCVPFEEERNPSLLGHAIQRLNANWAFLTSSVLSALRPETVPCLQTVCVGGEAVQASQISLWSNKVHLRQTYGSAETSAVVSSAHLTEDATTGDVGQPTTGRYWIVNPMNVHQLAPMGAVGEVIIESPTIGREYLDEPEKSASAFIQAPTWRKRTFGDAEAKSRFYKTGDLGSFTEQGEIKLWGRRDAQIKLRGQRIELGEIEHQARLASDLVKEVTVEIAAPKDSDGNRNSAFLVAFFVLQEGTSSETLRHEAMNLVQQRLQGVLPQYMIPSAFLVLQEMPKTISKKTDRRQLRDIAASYKRDELLSRSMNVYGDAPKRPPTTNQESILQSVWAHILGIDSEKIGRDDDFFHLGGDSVSALKLVAEARRAGLALSVSDVFTQRTLTALARLVTSYPPVAASLIQKFSLLSDGKSRDLGELRNELATACGVKSALIEDAYPCTPLQEGLLSLTLKQTGDYVLQNVLLLSEDIKLDDFQYAWQQTISAVPTLRTRIVQHRDLGPVQVVINGDIEWQHASTSEGLDHFLAEDKLKPIDFGLSLSRFTLVDGEAAGQPRWLVWTVHHALYDAWSLSLVFDMIRKTYVSRAVPSCHEFAPFIKYLQDIKPEEARTYWQSSLQNYDSVAFPPLPAPTHKPTASTAIEQGIRLQRVKHHLEITLSNLVRAALGITINRQTNTNDVLFGAVLSGRNASLPNIEKIVGPTTATVPIRVQFPVAQTVNEYLRAIQKQSIDMIPFEQTGLQRISRVNTSASEFHTLLVVHPTDEQISGATKDDVFGTWITDDAQGGFTTYALTLECFLPGPGEEEIRVKAIFDSTVIPEWEMGKLLDQFSVVLQQLVHVNPEHLLSDIDLMPPRDRALVWERNRCVPESVYRCVHDLIHERTAVQPDSIALSSWDGEMSYQDLHSLSDRLAQHLVTLSGFFPGAIIPLCFEKSMWTVVAMLASMKSGLTAVTMDITQPAERLRITVQQIGDPPFILSSVEGEKLASQLLSSKPVVVVGSRSTQSSRGHPRQLPSVTPSTPVCVVFTSGSSGVPKGAALTHANFCTGIHHQAKTFGHGPGARVFAFASYSFDISWFDTLHALASGSTLCIPSEAQRKDDLERSLAHSGATVAFMTPSVARLLRPGAVPTLRTLALGGEPQRWADFCDWPDSVKKLSVYGPAECTVVSAAEDAQLNLKMRDFTMPSSEGMGLNSWLVDPVNPNLLAPLGTTGEIWLEGPLIGAGYVGDDAKTAAAFIEDPKWLLQGGGSADLPGRRGKLYKTGDMARCNADGLLCFMGRKDTQVKIRGQRVELAEIEHHLRRTLDEDEHPPQIVAETIALNTAGNDSSLLLVAFVERQLPNARGEGSLDQLPQQVDLKATSISVNPELIDKLMHHLPSYMVPRVYFSIPSIPRTVNGKTDRKRLRHLVSGLSLEELTDQNPANNEPKAQPTTAIQSCLQRLWAQVLKISPDCVGLNDNFFQIGGDSIAAMRLVGLARAEGIPTLTVAGVFSFPLLRDQAAKHQLVHPRALQQNGTVAPFSLLPKSIHSNTICEELAQSFEISDPVEDLYPCTPLQEGLFALTSKHAGGYVMQSVMELSDSPAFDLSAFKAAWAETVRITDILRTRIVEHDQLGLAQIVIQQDGIRWLRSEETLDCYLSQDKMVPMDLGMALTRFALIGSHKTTGGPQWFVWTAHHALYDGWSLPMITDRAANLYWHLINGSPKICDCPTVKFSSFVQYVERQVADEQLKSFWQDILAGPEDAIPFPQLPASILQPMPNRTIEQSHSLNLASHLTSTTTSTLVRAALALLLSQHTGVPEAIFGATVSGRNAPIASIEHIVGPTIATVPLRIPVPGKCRVGDFLARVQQQATQMIPYEQAGLQKISRVSDNARQACRFQTLLVMQPPATSGDNEQPENYGIWRTDANQEGFTTYALTIECTPMQEGLGLAFRAIFDDRIVEHWQIERLLNRMAFLVQQLVQVSSNGTLAELNIVSPEDEEMIWKWNASVPEAIDRCVHDIIFDVVRERPNSQSVCAWDGDLTYAQLNHHADNLAATLVLAGITSGMIVPLCFEKSKWAAVGVFGVLKAGAAFVFLDAETQPQPRLRTIVEQANATIICSSVKHQGLSRDLGTATIIVGPEFLPTAPAALPRVDPTGPLYLNFTSGSTGLPKGAMVSHRSFSSALHHQLDPLNINHGTRLYDFASYSFDVSIHNMLATLSAGGCLCVPSGMDRKTRLSESMEEMQTNYIDLTASVSRLLDPQDVPTLRTLTFGGEAVSQDDAERWWGKARLINSCGPSECTPMSVINSKPENPAALRRIGLGTGMLTWIVDPADHHRLLPVGQVGELILEGPLLGSGYLNDPARTETTFIESPRWLSGRRSRTRVYKTGDLVRYHSDGSLHILGRKDTQVKIRGQRVELEEVEHHLRRLLPGDTMVVVDAVMVNSSTTLVAFLCLNPAATKTTTPQLDSSWMSTIATLAAKLTEQASCSLSPYMVPSLYVPLVTIPMSATGKTNRKELRAFASSLSRELIDQMRGLPESKQSMRAPVTDLERRLQHLWARILQIPADTISLGDSFIGSGGDSIMAMQLVGESRKEGLQFSVADVFRERTIANLLRNAVAIGGKMVETVLPSQPFHLVDQAVREKVLSIVRDPTNVSDILPMTDFQVQSITQPCNYFYLDFGTAPIEHEGLQNSCQSLLDRYPLLRSTFVKSDDRFFQVELRQELSRFALIESDSPLDLACDAVCAEDSSVALLQYEVFTKFILVRSTQGTRGTTVSRLIIRLSHAQYDGISFPVMIHTLGKIYTSQQQPSPASSPDASFALYLAHLMRQRSQSHLYWKDHLAGLYNTPIASTLSSRLKSAPSRRSGPFHKVQAEEAVALPPQLPGDLVQSTLLSSAWAILLSLLTGRNDIVFGHLIASRDLPMPSGGGHRIVGPCVNIIPVRVKLNTPSEQMNVSNIRALPCSIHQQLLSLRETGVMMGCEDIIRSCTNWSRDGDCSILDSVVQHQNINENPEIEIAGICAKLHWYDNPNALPPVPFGVASYPVDGESNMRIRILSSTQYITSEMAGWLVGYLCEIVGLLVNQRVDEDEERSSWDDLAASVRAELGEG